MRFSLFELRPLDADIVERVRRGVVTNKLWCSQYCCYYWSGFDIRI
jgi:hypothetical protein